MPEKTMKLYTVYNQDAREHCAMEKTLIEIEEPFFYFTTIQQAAFIGVDISVDALKLDYKETTYVRYMGTGGPVYFDGGNIKTGFLVDKSYSSWKCIEWVVDALNSIGIPAESKEDTNDIFLNGKKICGFGKKDCGEMKYIAFFFTLNLNLIEAEKSIILTKHVKNLGERATAINVEMNKIIIPEQILNALLDTLPKYFNYNTLPEILDIALVDSNREQFYNTEWLMNK